MMNVLVQVIIPHKTADLERVRRETLRWRMVRKCVMRTGWRERETRESSRKGGMNEMTARCVSIGEKDRGGWKKC